MRLARVVALRFQSLFRRSRVETDLDREMAFHIEQLQLEYRDAGMSEQEARAAAQRAFGSPAFAQDACRDTRRVALLEDLARDVAHGWRLLAKSPVFTATAVLSLALGIGANTAIFTLIHQVILRLLPVRDPQTLVSIGRSDMRNPDLSSFSHHFLRDLQAARDLPFEGFLGFSGMGRTTLVTNTGAEPVAGEVVSGNYFELLGVRPAMGRLFNASDDQAQANPVTVLSHNFWVRRFGRDASILNQTIRINHQPFTVIGVSAESFDGLAPGYSPDFRIPFSMLPAIEKSQGRESMLDSRSNWWLSIFGRVKPGATLEQARASLDPLMARNQELIADSRPLTDYRKKLIASERMQVTEAAQGTGRGRKRYERALLAMAAITAAVLLIACLNIALLLMARASAREREFSVRMAIGASRGRVLRQLITESLMLSVAGAVLGLAVAAVFGRLLINMVVSDEFHSTLDASPNWAALAFNFSTALVAGLVFGLAPAWHASRLGLSSRLNEGIRSTRLAGRQLLISTQVALAVVVLAGAGLFLRTLRELRSLDLGFQPQRVLQIAVDPAGYSDGQRVEFFRRATREIAAIPGVQAVSAGGIRVVSDSAWGSGIRIEGVKLPEGDPGPNRDVVGANYFSTLGIPLITGRDFTEADLAPNAPRVAIINQRFARFYFGDQNPLGKRIGPSASTQPEHTIVGVAKDGKYARLREEPTRFWYAPYTQNSGGPARSLTIYARTSMDPNALIGAVRSRIAAIDRNLALFDVKTIEEQLNHQLTLERLLSILSVSFGALAAFLAAMGLFGVLSYSVTRREREIGIRIALGALPFRAAWVIIRQVVLFVLLGIAAGLAGALAVTQLLEKLLFGVKPGDPIAIAGACLLMLAVALTAVFFPARKAASVEPAITLRSE